MKNNGIKGRRRKNHICMLEKPNPSNRYYVHQMLHLFEAIKTTVVYFCDLKAKYGSNQVAHVENIPKILCMEKPLTFDQY